MLPPRRGVCFPRVNRKAHEPMNVFFHTRTAGQRNWDNREIGLLDFGRLPVVGEFISVGNQTPDWHQVELVVHVAFPADFVAEVYCVAVNHLDAMKAALDAGAKAT